MISVVRLRVKSLTIGAVSIVSMAMFPSVFAQSQVAREWMLFDQILYIGIGVGVVVFGLMFYALIKYREKPVKEGAR